MPALGSSSSRAKAPVADLKLFAESRGIGMKTQKEIVSEAAETQAQKHSDTSEIKADFDRIILDTEQEVHRVYLRYEQAYGEAVIKVFIDHLVENGELGDLAQTGEVLSKYFKVFDRFYLSLGNSRKSRAGKAFESIHNSLFKRLGYPFDEQVVINGKPDFLMPSAKHYEKNPMDCIIFTAKRTIRERWRQIVTEGTRGLGFYLATIDERVSENQLKEMLQHRIYLVVPEEIQARRYRGKENVLSFRQFFEDHLDPRVEVWRRHKVIS
jgi:hypothetical protein